MDFGQAECDSYFMTGDRGYHRLWDSRFSPFAAVSEVSTRSKQAETPFTEASTVTRTTRS